MLTSAAPRLADELIQIALDPNAKAYARKRLLARASKSCVRTSWRLSSGGSYKKFSRHCIPLWRARQSLFNVSFNFWSGWGLIVTVWGVSFRQKSVMLVATAVAATQRLPHAVTDKQPIQHKSEDTI